jgi:hypothetical protein
VTDASYVARINRVVDYIDANLAERLGQLCLPVIAI